MDIHDIAHTPRCLARKYFIFVAFYDHIWAD